MSRAVSTFIPPLLVLVLFALRVASSPVERSGAGRRHLGNHHHERHAQRDEIIVQKCGRELADVIASLCRGRGYNTPHDSSYRPNSSAQRNDGGGGGIVNECCLRACRRSVLEKYCKKASSDSNESSDSRSVVDDLELTNRIRPESGDEKSSEQPSVEVRANEHSSGDRCFTGKSKNYTDVNSGASSVGTIPKRYNNLPITRTTTRTRNNIK